MNNFIDDFDEKALYSPPITQPVRPSSNPLEGFYRTPGLSIALATKGAFLPRGAYEPSMTGDLQIWPMRAADEMLLKNPDSLMNGYAIEMLLKSCVPGIKTPRLISTPDLDILLLAIRAATYGVNMGISATCPKCREITEFNCHLPTLLATVKEIPVENPVRLSDEVVAYIRPYNMGNATNIANASYEEARKLRSLDQANDELRNAEVNKSIDRINWLNLELLADCVMKVVVPGSEVTDRKQIVDFIANVPKPWVEKVDAKLRELNKLGMDKSLAVKCANATCNHEWTTELEFDPSNFFAGASSK